MSIDQVIEQFRPVFRAELPDRVGRIHDGLQAEGAGRAPEGLQRAFREAHSLAAMAAYMSAPEVTAAAEKLAVLTRELLANPQAGATDRLGDAWREYDRLRAAAAAYLGVAAVGPARAGSEAGPPDG